MLFYQFFYMSYYKKIICFNIYYQNITSFISSHHIIELFFSSIALIIFFFWHTSRDVYGITSKFTGCINKNMTKTQLCVINKIWSQINKSILVVRTASALVLFARTCGCLPWGFWNLINIIKYKNWF